MGNLIYNKCMITSNTPYKTECFLEELKKKQWTSKYMMI